MLKLLALAIAIAAAPISETVTTSPVAVTSPVPDAMTIQGVRTDMASTATLVSPNPCLLSAGKATTVAIRVDGQERWSVEQPYDASILLHVKTKNGELADLRAIPGVLLWRHGKSYLYSFPIRILPNRLGEGGLVLQIIAHNAPVTTGPVKMTEFAMSPCQFVP